jgi:molybdenum cofactor cytidylyltransferase
MNYMQHDHQNDMPSSIGVVILAAGASRRMGRPKQLLLLNGEALVRRTARIALALDCGPVVVVTGAYADAVEAALEGCDVAQVFCGRWEEGMGASLRTGVGELSRRHPDLQAVLILLVDQPGADTEYLQELIKLFQRGGMPVAASEYEETTGPPAVFSRMFFPELLALQGDAGAKKLLLEQRSQCISLPFPAGGMDLDTPEDWGKWISL